ncbi:hypothetical protein J6590_104273, partial [Homalodisca vitripennis]
MIYTPREVCELIANAGKKHPGTITPVDTNMIVGYSSWWPTTYKKTSVSFETRHLPKNKKSHFSISKYNYFEFSALRKGVVKASEFIRSGGFITLETFLLQKVNHVKLPEEEAYPEGKISIKKPKIEDIIKAMPFIPDDHKDFYREIIQWPSTDT